MRDAFFDSRDTLAWNPLVSLRPSTEAAMPHPMWQELYNAALVEFYLAKLPERVETACQAIHQQRVRKGQALTVGGGTQGA